jgi:hypothetical protein
VIHQIAKDLGKYLASRGCGFPVYDKEATAPTTWARNRVVVARGDEDKVGPPRFQSRNPKVHFIRTIPATITIFAQSTKTGAQEFEHRRVADNVVDMVLIALRSIAGTRKSGLAIVSSKRVPIDDLEKSERVGGYAHEIAFTIERAVSERTWAGAIQDEFEVIEGGIRSVTKVAYSGSDDDGDINTAPASAETACGG